MKKLLIAILALTILSLGAFAGELTGKGIKVGLNMANASGDVENNSMLMTFAVGGFLTYGINDKIALQPEIYYFGKGYHFKIDIPLIGSEETDVKLSYLEIPILAKYYIGESEIMPSIYAGPAIGLLLSATADGDDIKDGYKGMDLGLVLGVGGQYAVGNGAITFDARYSLGLSNVADSDDFTAKNNVISILVGYSF